MTSLKLLSEFWKTATFHDFSAMYKRIMPHTGEDYHREKFQLFRGNIALWLCDLTPENLEKVRGYLKARHSIDQANQEDLKFTNQVKQFSPEVLAEFLASIYQNKESRQWALVGLASIQDVFDVKNIFHRKPSGNEKMTVDPVVAEPTGMTNHQNSN